MSEWDFGYGREPTEHHEPRHPQQPPYSYPEQQEPQYPYDPADQPDAAGWPGADGYPAADDSYDPPTGYPITYERDEFEGRTSPAPRALPPEASQPGMAPAYSPWPDAPDPADRFDAESSAHPWRPAPAVGEPDAADRTQAWYPGPRQSRIGSSTPKAPQTPAWTASATRPRSRVAAGRAAPRLRRRLASGGRRLLEPGGTRSRGRRMRSRGGTAPAWQDERRAVAARRQALAAGRREWRRARPAAAAG